MILQSHQTNATLQLGQQLATLLKPGMVLALDGDLGAGKTVISRGIARGLNITEPVTSPTFTVVQEYKLPNCHDQWLYHLDMYRINDSEAALAFGIDEYLFARNAITLVEWPERISDLLQDDQQFTIKLSHIDEETRQIEIPDFFQEGLLHAGIPESIKLL
ncbi:MAG: tRNA (adenosine(37)-N6)-threonylcarbamoyltransferase complex ATPase subunit type 1 TsaE [Lentisphaeria bacterium]